MKAFFIFACGVLLSACSSPETKVKFENRGAIYIPVEIAGRTYPFLFDTGSKTSIFSEVLLKEAGESVEIRKRDSTQKAGDDTSRWVVRTAGKARLNIGGISLKSSFESETGGQENQLGMDAIGQKHWLVNFKDTTVTLSARPIRLNADSLKRMDLMYPSNKETIKTDLRLNGTAYENFTLYLNTPFDTIPKADKDLNIQRYELLLATAPGHVDSLADKLGSQGGAFSLLLPDDKRFMLFKRMKVEGMDFQHMTATLAELPSLANTSGVNGTLGLMTLDFVTNHFSYLRINPDLKKVTLFSDGQEESEQAKAVEKTLRMFERAFPQADSSKSAIQLRSGITYWAPIPSDSTAGTPAENPNGK